ncbi:MAG: hypothetical protein J6A89_09110 [Clostridia bacterium]|nr:hypothetical protein [Clostridia bacterium]
MKKKKILIIIAVLLIVVIGVFVYFYKTTDFLKTNQQLFWKYAVQNSEIAEIFNNEEMEEIKNKKVTNSYKSTSSLEIKKDDDIYTIDVNTNAKNANDIFTVTEFKKNSSNIIDFNLVKKSNLVGVKIDELANGYITLKNTNLKDLAQKIGIQDRQKIPDNINVSTYMDILDISQEDISYITDKYTKLMVSGTSSKNYSKGESVEIKVNDKIHTGTAYKISLTENECKKILSDVFLELSKDSRTLNLISSKMKLLNLPSESTEINTISNKFSEISKNINEIETTDDEFIEVTVYVENYELLQTNIKIKQEKIIKILFDKENNKINIKQDLLNQGENNNKFILSISDALNKISEQVEEINIQNEVSEDKTSVTTKMEIICKDKLNIIYSSNTKITDDIEINADYDNSLKIVLNDLSETELKNLYKAIVENAPKIYEEKKVLILNESTQSADNSQAGENVPIE